MNVDDTIAQVASGSPSPLEGLVGQTLGGRYRVEALLGRGGMGAVFRAHHLRLQQDVAVKVLRPELANHPEAAPRFEREAQASSRLEHPNIVRVMDFGDVEAGGFDEPIKFLVMQLLEGQELSEMLGEPMGVQRSLVVVAQILDALVHAHERGVVHRDLKPDNIFVTTDHQGNETLKLVDFGIAKLLDSTDQPGKPLTQVGMVFGTPAYMSPEQAVGNPVDERTDLYAVGVMLYEMLSGHRPFRSDDPMTLLRMQILAEVEPIDGLRPDVQAIVSALMAKEPDERTPTAAAALERVQTALGPGAMPSSTSAPLRVEASGPQPTVPPLSAPRSVDAVPSGPMSVGGRPKWMAPAGVAAGVLLLTVGGAIVFSGDDEPEDAVETVAADLSPGREQAQHEVREAVRDGVEKIAAVTGMRTPPERLEELDRLIKGRRFDTANAMLQSLESEFSDDPQLAWRRGKLLRRHRKRKAEGTAAYARAMKLDPGLLDDDEFASEVRALLKTPKPDSALINALASTSTPQAQVMLAGLANRSESALSYSDRHRVLQSLGERDGVNGSLNQALDLWQAGETDTPCATFLGALDDAEADPHPFLRGSVERAPVPKPGEGEDPKACEGAETRRKQVAAKLAQAYPDAELQYPEDYRKDARRRGGGGKRRRRGIFRRIFR